MEWSDNKNAVSNHATHNTTTLVFLKRLSTSAALPSVVLQYTTHQRWETKGADSDGHEEVPNDNPKYVVNKEIDNEKAISDSYIVRRGIPRVSGIYVKGQIEGVKAIYTIDTGASATLVSTRILQDIPKDRRPKIDSTQCLHFMGPTGNDINIHGTVTLHMSMGKFEITKEVSVADIHDDCLLGADILLSLEEGPFDFHLSENRLQWNGVSIPCIQVRRPVSCMVLCAADCTIPGYSEWVVEAVVRNNDKLFDEETELVVREVLIEPSESFHDKHKLLMASSLVRLESNQSTMVRVMNPFPKEALLKNGMIMGEANPFDQVIPFLDEESVSKDSTEVAQRLQVIQSDEVSSTVDSPSLSYIEEGSTCVSPERSGVQIQIPSHLQDLYERTTSVIAMGEHCKVAELLSDFS